MDDVDAFAERTTRLLRDPALRADMGSRAYTKLERRFRIDRVVDRYIEVYREAIEAHRAGRLA
jgi:glycosyltransferase involved in cell wall biosynthesis